MSAAGTTCRHLFASSSTATWSCGLLLFGCLFLPLTSGCNGSDIYPVQLYQWNLDLLLEKEVTAETLSAIVVTQWVNSPYLFGLVAAGGAMLVALLGRPAIYRWLWWIYATLGIVLAISLWLTIGYTAKQQTDFELMKFAREHPWSTMPPLIVPAILVLTRANCYTWTAAALAVQVSLACLAGGWFFSLWYFEPDAQWGVKVALLASGGLAAGSLLQRWHANNLFGPGVADDQAPGLRARAESSTIDSR